MTKTGMRIAHHNPSRESVTASRAGAHTAVNAGLASAVAGILAARYPEYAVLAPFAAGGIALVVIGIYASSADLSVTKGMPPIELVYAAAFSALILLTLYFLRLRRKQGVEEKT